MLVRHATPRKNLKSITRTGIDPTYSKGKRLDCWFHVPSKSSWGVLHTVRRHGGKAEDVVIVECDIPRAWLTRRAKGLWSCTKIIPPTRFRRVFQFPELSVSPVPA
jgi:hypothetical protein